MAIQSFCPIQYITMPFPLRFSLLVCRVLNQAFSNREDTTQRVYLSLPLNVLLVVCVSSVCQFLARCQSPTGGFAGGPGQHAHLAPTYAAVNALCIIGTAEAYNVINRYCTTPSDFHS